MLSHSKITCQQLLSAIPELANIDPNILERSEIEGKKRVCQVFLADRLSCSAL